MSEIEREYEEDEFDEVIEPAAGVVAAKQALFERCKAAGISFEEVTIPEERWTVRVVMKCGRNIRTLNVRSVAEINRQLIRWSTRTP
jgi:hypothetical protein